MIQLLESEIRTNQRQSSKGNQLKWQRDGRWYKADYAGYEGLAEYVVSSFLRHSTLPGDRFVAYRTEEMAYREQRYLGCSSPDFMTDGMQLITWERLYRQATSRSLQEDVFRIGPVGDRISFLTDQLERISHLPKQDILEYLAVVLTVDAVFLNEDRHMHNLAFLMDEDGKFHFCPLFDHGACLLSDTTIDYPAGCNVYRMIRDVPGRTVSRDLDEQLDAVERIRNASLRFHINRRQAEQVIMTEPFYPDEIKRRVLDIVLARMGKYGYLFEA